MLRGFLREIECEGARMFRALLFVVVVTRVASEAWSLLRIPCCISASVILFRC